VPAPVRADPGPAARADPRPAARPGDRLGIDRFELGILVCFAALGCWFWAVLIVNGGDLVGAEGFVIADQMQYFTWVRQASEHVLIANQFDMRPDSHSFLHPGVLASGGLSALGLSVPLAYLVWKPIGLLVFFWGARSYVHRLVAGIWERRAALVLAIFFIPPAVGAWALFEESGSARGLYDALGGGETSGTLDFIAQQLWPPGQLWGYLLNAVALGVMPLAFLWAERAIGEARAGTVGGGTTALATAGVLVVTWFHPWQGAAVVGILGLAALWHVWAREASVGEVVRALWVPVAVTLALLLYFSILTRADAAWAIYEDGNDDLPRWPAWTIAVSLGPLVLPALLAYRGRAADFQERILRLWPVVALMVYLAPVGFFPFHAFTGLAIPLSVLAVRGAAPYLARMQDRRLGAALAVAAVVLLIVPGTVDRLRKARTAVVTNPAYRLEPGERDALESLEDDPHAGGVLAPGDLGQLVPFMTGRETWLGTMSWTPDFEARRQAVDDLFAGRSSPAEARRLLRSSGARYLLSGCGEGRRFEDSVESLLESQRRFGCATLYRLRS
jgi:hypothetical protein